MPETLVSPPEKLEQKNKEDRLGELLKIEGDHFITDDLARYAEVPDRVKFLLHKGGTGIQIMIIDGSKILLDEIEGKFSLLRKEDLHDFPEVRIARNIYYKPLIYALMGGIAPNILYVDMIEAAPELRGQGIIPLFYQRLEGVAKQAGYAFLAGSHTREKIAKAYLRQGRYFIEEIKPEFQKEFEEIIKERDSHAYDTIKFLNQEDVERYIKADCLHKSIDERMEYRNKLAALDYLFDSIDYIIRDERSRGKANIQEGVKRLVKKLNGILERYNPSQASVINEKEIISFISALDTIRNRKEALLSCMSLEELQGLISSFNNTL